MFGYTSKFLTLFCGTKQSGGRNKEKYSVLPALDLAFAFGFCNTEEE